MTPAQSRALAVAMDGLSEAGFDEATLARMRRAVEPRIEAAVRNFAKVQWARFQRAAEEELRAVAATLPPLSPAETPAGASTPQPPGETCSRCGGPELPIPCGC